MQQMRGGPPGEPGKRKKVTLRETKQIAGKLSFLIEGQSGRLWLLFLTIVLSIAFQLMIPVMIQRCLNVFIDRGAYRDPKDAVMRTLIVLVMIFLLNSVCSYFKSYLSAQISEKAARTLRERLYAKVTDMPISESDKYSFGDAMSRLTNDSIAVCSFIQIAELLLSTICLVIGCGIIMLFESWQLSLITFGFTAVSVFAVQAISKRTYGSFLIRQTKLGKMNSHIEETFQNYRTVDLTGTEKRAVAKMEEYSADLYKASLRAALVSGTVSPVMLVLGNAGFLATVTAGAYLAIDGIITVGVLQAVIMYSKQFTDSAFNIGNAAVQVQTSLASAERVLELLGGDEESAADGEALPGKGSAGSVIFDNVSFKYEKSDSILSGCSFEAESGKQTAIVGRTGAGKTTLINLLLRFFDGYEGNIFLGGKNIRSLSPDEIRSSVSVILQDCRLIHGTVWDNLVYGASDQSRDDVLKVAQLSEVDSFVRKLPSGYDTIIKENDERITKGQKQLIGIARALISKSPVIIMDEASSSVDAETEKRIKSRLFGSDINSTVIMIAHRLETVRDADKIVVISGGRAAEQGTHDELMALGGEYSRLFASQTQGKEI